MRHMALIHQATLSPTKVELLAAWLPGRSWFPGAPGSPTYQVPLTYRGAPLEGGDDWLVGTLEHSVLGTRWVYDATGDLVYAEALAQAVLTGSGQAQEFVDNNGHLEPRPPSMAIMTSNISTDFAKSRAVTAVLGTTPGDPTLIETDKLTLTVPRLLGHDVSAPGAVLFGTWPGQAASIPLAFANPR
jgi:hypothetical protein